jgi:hypothetical protein
MIIIRLKIIIEIYFYINTKRVIYFLNLNL